MSIFDSYYGIYDRGSHIFNTFWIDANTREPWADEEVFSINYMMTWTYTFYSSISQSIPDDLNAIVERYNTLNHCGTRSVFTLRIIYLLNRL